MFCKVRNFGFLAVFGWGRFWAIFGTSEGGRKVCLFCISICGVIFQFRFSVYCVWSTRRHLTSLLVFQSLKDYVDILCVPINYINFTMTVYLCSFIKIQWVSLLIRFFNIYGLLLFIMNIISNLSFQSLLFIVQFQFRFSLFILFQVRRCVCDSLWCLY